VKEIDTAKLSERIQYKGIYITPLEVLEDSRCAVDVTCIWAGQVRLRVKLEKETSSQEVILISGDKVTFTGAEISLSEVLPAPNSKNTIEAGDYRFTFSVATETTSKTGHVTGKVTTSPTCPVERIPPDPACDPKPYKTTITVKDSTNKIIKSITTNSTGDFSFDIAIGTYIFEAKSGQVFPRCSQVTIEIKGGDNSVPISCDSGIR
jgi:hypothetical protein